jgi:hypothetical protein
VSRDSKQEKRLTTGFMCVARDNFTADGGGFCIIGPWTIMVYVYKEVRILRLCVF